jgi:hypothetical protein
MTLIEVMTSLESPDDTGFINPLVSQLSVEPNVDMDTGFANGHVVRDSHTAQGSISPLCDIGNRDLSFC